MHTLTLDQRRSTPSRLLVDPGPGESEQLELLRIASRVPDHGAVAPFRFLRIRGDERARLGELLAHRKRELEPECDENALAKERGRFVSAPVVITVIGCYQSPHKIPVIEQQMTAACVCLTLLQAAQAAGFGAQWLTGWAAYDVVIRQRLGITESEAVVGFIHIGSAREQINERPRPDPAARLQDWKA
jgi:nitroreductase